MVPGVVPSPPPERKGTPASRNATPDDTRMLAFRHCPDFSRLNSKCHNATRVDTFRTPAKGARPPSQDGARGIVPVPQLIEISEMSFATSMNTLREEVCEAVEGMRREVSEKVCNFAEHGMAMMLAELLKKVDDVHEEVKARAVDLTPLHNQFARQQEVIFGLSAKLAQIMDEQDQAWTRQERAETVLHEIRAEALKAEQRSHASTAEVFQSLQDAVSAKAGATMNAIQELQESSRRSVEALVPRLEERLKWHLQSQFLNVDFTQVLEQGQDALDACHSEFSLVLSEISKVQQALNIEFCTPDPERHRSSGRSSRTDGTSRFAIHHYAGDEMGETDLVYLPRSPKLSRQASMASMLSMASSARGASASAPGDTGEYCPVTPVQPPASRSDDQGPLAISDAKWDVGSPQAVGRASKVSSSLLDLASARNPRKRLREYWAQTDPPLLTQDAICQTDPVKVRPDVRQEKKRKEELRHFRTMQLREIFMDGGETVDTEECMKTRTIKDSRAVGRVFGDVKSMRKQARELHTKPHQSAAFLYREDGVAQRISTSWWFENLTFAVICLNCVWIAVDTDFNHEDVLIESEPSFQIVEHCFCMFFTFELAIRLLSLKRLSTFWMDKWFVYDGALVLLAIIETWVLTLFFLVLESYDGVSLLGNTALFRIVRVLRILRISRIARLLRAIPEVCIFMRGIGAAARALFVCIVLWTCVIYMFAVLFRQLTEGEAIGEEYFETVPAAMNTLLVRGILPEYSTLIYDLADASPVFWLLVVSFILVASVTLMYMLLGVLVEVIRHVASNEKERTDVSILAFQLRRTCALYDIDVDGGGIPKDRFKEVIYDEAVQDVLLSLDVEPKSLVDVFEEMFRNCPVGEAAQNALSLDVFVETIMSSIGSNPTTVKDVKDQMRATKALFQEQYVKTRLVVKDEFVRMRQLLRNLKAAELDSMFHAWDSEDEPEDDVRPQCTSSPKALQSSSSHLQLPQCRQTEDCTSSPEAMQRTTSKKMSAPARFKYKYSLSGKF